MVELTVGNWHRVASFTEFELLHGVGEPFYYFFKRLSDDIMSDLLQRGAQSVY